MSFPAVDLLVESNLMLSFGFRATEAQTADNLFNADVLHARSFVGERKVIGGRQSWKENGS